jgi:hypothetical protein
VLDLAPDQPNCHTAWVSNFWTRAKGKLDKSRRSNLKPWDG